MHLDAHYFTVLLFCFHLLYMLFFCSLCKSYEHRHLYTKFDVCTFLSNVIINIIDVLKWDLFLSYLRPRFFKSKSLLFLRRVSLTSHDTTENQWSISVGHNATGNITIPYSCSQIISPRSPRRLWESKLLTRQHQRQRLRSQVLFALPILELKWNHKSYETPSSSPSIARNPGNRWASVSPSVNHTSWTRGVARLFLEGAKESIFSALRALASRVWWESRHEQHVNGCMWICANKTLLLDTETWTL